MAMKDVLVLNAVLEGLRKEGPIPGDDASPVPPMDRSLGSAGAMGKPKPLVESGDVPARIEGARATQRIRRGSGARKRRISGPPQGV